MLCLGNSITLHGVREEVGWFSEWGMAASRREKDYCRRLSEMIGHETVEGVIPLNVAEWERDFGTDLEPVLARYGGVGLIIIRLGENVEDVRHFTEALVRLIGVCRRHSGSVLITGCWWPHRRKEAAILGAALRTGVRYVRIDDISRRRDVYPRIGDVLYDVEGRPYRIEKDFITGHPNDLGMELIAQRIFESLGV